MTVVRPEGLSQRKILMIPSGIELERAAIYRNIFYVAEIWLLPVRQEHGLNVFENMV